MANKLKELHKDARPIARKHLELIQHLLAEYAPWVTAKLTSTWRSHEEQNALYAKGRTAPGKIVTRAQPKDTPHCVTAKDGTPASMAWDICLVEQGGLIKDDDRLWDLIPLTAYLVAQDDIESGAYFKSIRDMPHTQIRDWQKLCQDGILIA